MSTCKHLGFHFDEGSSATRSAAPTKLQQFLDEYHSGKRDDEDGYVILHEMLPIYGAEHRAREPAVQKLLQEWKALQLKHPEFKKMRVYELHESRDQRAEDETETADAQTKAATFMPADSHVTELYGSGSVAMAVHQYSLDFYQLPNEEALKENLNDTVLYKDGVAIDKEQIDSISPKKVLTFEHLILVMPRTPTTVDYPVWVCEDLLHGYSPESKEERLIIKAKGFRGKYPWVDKSAEFKNFCGAVSLSGDVIYRLPFELSLPDQLVEVLEVTNEGKRAVLVLGEKVAVQTEDELAVIVGNPRKVFIWTYPDRLKTIDLPTTDPEIQSILKTYGY